MKIIHHSVCALVICSLLGCGPSGSESVTATPEPAMDALVPAADMPVTSSFAPWTCPVNSGEAPSGDLIATRIVSANTSRTEPGLYEGPVWLNGALYFSDFTFREGFPSRIQRLNSDGTVETVIADSGSNGLALDADGYLIAGTHNTKALSRFNVKTGERDKIVGLYDGNVFNSPNDLTEAREGSLYFTDPAFQRSAAPGGQEKTNVFQVSADGVVRVVDDSIENPNGISLSPEQDILYVVGGGENGFLRAYPIVDGVPGKGKNLVEGLTIPDGMAIDCLGNVYVTEHTLQRLRVFNPKGEQLAIIKVDANITNAAFGGPEGKTLYLTGAGSVWSIKLNVAGFPY